MTTPLRPLLTTHLEFDRGTLVVKDPPAALLEAHSHIKWDERTQVYRTPAFLYREVALFLHRGKYPFQDSAKNFETQAFSLKTPLTPRSYQAEALAAWQKEGGRAVVTLPTGAGKTVLAVLAIAHTNRPTLVHVPTLDLMQQWYEVLKRFFGEPVGLLGGGYNEIHPITVATYDSALIHVTSKGNRFGLLVFDECHHLPGEQTKYAALANIAPYRLGLTATPERTDGGEHLLYEICGPLCYEAHIQDLKGNTLAPYDVHTVEVEMEPAEREEYDAAREVYVAFVRRENIDFGRANGWQQFIWKASRSPSGKAAFQAYLRQKKLSNSSAAKEKIIWELLVKHRDGRILIFTQDNETAYRIGRKYVLPVLTHHTKVKEREAFLNNFRSGAFSVLVTSKVLNEGVDVPEANVAIIVSGSGSVREHVQRLGRVLRAQPGKRAVLYELISRGTGEKYVNQRRRQHSAYEKSPTL